MFWNRLACLGIALAFLTGCHAVYSTTPMGEAPAIVIPDDWEGTWLHKDIAVTVAVLDSEKGILEVGWVEQKQDRLHFEHYKVQLRKSGEWLFGNVQDPEKPKLYVWARVRNEDDQIIVWVPDLDKAKTLIEKGVLPGRVEKADGDVVLTGPAAAELKIIMSAENGMIFDWAQPRVFRRLSN